MAITLLALAASTRAATDAAWNPTGSMSVGRFVFTATTLQNNQVLVAGGEAPGQVATATADLYNPLTGTFTATGNMKKPRVGFTATRLANGRVLVAGGATDAEIATNTAELYDPTSETWSIN